MKPGINLCSSEFRDRLTLQAFSGADDGRGGKSEAWSDLADMYVKIWPWKGDTKFIGSEFQGEVRHLLYTRYTTLPQPLMRFRQQRPGLPDRLYKIVYLVDLQELHRVLEMYCEEGVAI